MPNNNSHTIVRSRRSALRFGAVGLTGALAGCVGGLIGSEGELNAEITVTHWPLLMYNPPYQVALENGYFEEEGVEIESIVGSSGGGTTVRNVVTGGLPFGEVATPAAVNAYNSGAPLRIIASATNTAGSINWVSPSDSDVTEVEDLEGETVGYTSAGSVTQNTLGLAFEEIEAVDIDSVEFQAMGGLGEGHTAVEEGNIAAAANLEPVFSNQQQDDAWNVVFEAADYIDEFQQTVLIAGPDVLDEHPDAVEGFIRARERGVEFIRENPTESAEIFASHNEGYEPEEMESAIENVNPDEYYTTGEFSVPGLQTIERGMKNIDLVDDDVPWSEIVDQSFLDDDKHIEISEAES